MPSTPDIRVPAPRQPEPQHQPWCDSHIPDDQTFGTCVSADIVLPGQIVGLTWRAGEGVRVMMCAGDRIEVVTVDEAEQRATALTAIVAVARAHTPQAVTS